MEGTYSQSFGSAICSTCDPGKYANGSGNSICTNCSVGTYSSQSGSNACLPCAQGFFQPSDGSNNCLTCASCDDNNPNTIDLCEASTGNCLHYNGGTRLEVMGSMYLKPLPGPPNNPQEGSVYFDTNLKRMRIYDGRNWVTIE
jgi:hypothetical protein